MKPATRREFLKAAGRAAASAPLFSMLPGCSAVHPKPAAKTSRPNILFIITDDQRFDTITALGNKYVLTPNIDRLVHNGTTLTNACIMGSNSGAVCMPSRAMLMSGKHLFQLADKGRTIPPEHIMLPQTLRQAGYRTFATGKWHNGKATFARAFTNGANIFFGGMSDHYNVPIFDFDPTGAYPNQSRYKKQGKHSSELFTDAAVDFLQACNNSKPFFAYVSYTAPHDPRTAPKKYRDMYKENEMPLPANFMAEHPFDNGEMRIRDEKLAPWPRTPEEIRRHLADYYAMITHVDAQIGRVLQALEQTGQADNTIIVFTADNGLAVGRHGLMGKQNLYDHSVHVPLIICAPGLGKGKRLDALCYIHDLYPTLCELVGLKAPESVETRSLVPVLTGTRLHHRSSLFFAYKDYQRAVRDHRYKLIEYSVQGKRHTRLFDLQTDPLELRDLSDNTDYTPHLHRLRDIMRRWKNNLGDTGSFWQEFQA